MKECSRVAHGLSGFGRRISWVEDGVVPPGHKMTFKNALHTVSIGVMAKMLLPGFVMKLSSFLRTIDLAFDELGVRSCFVRKLLMTYRVRST